MGNNAVISQNRENPNYHRIPPYLKNQLQQGITNSPALCPCALKVLGPGGGAVAQEACEARKLPRHSEKKFWRTRHGMSSVSGRRAGNKAVSVEEMVCAMHDLRLDDTAFQQCGRSHDVLE